MKEFINSLTGTRMVVSDEREKEYLDAGHQPVAPEAQAAPPAPAASLPVSYSPLTAGSPAGAESGGGENREAEPPPPKKSAAAPRRKTAQK